ncbi:hypothetical protein [Zoogloea sp.]|uniref:hypothetical protein n=1 Tax=Zoogloea sp. TaxID=49181 RepID=UPI0014159A0F|nr:MAG: Flp family type IVb pilin [Zoogloea sp.]
MKKISATLSRLIREEEGAAATEYAILVALIAAAVAAAVTIFDIQGIYTTMRARVVTAMG